MTLRWGSWGPGRSRRTSCGTCRIPARRADRRRGVPVAGVRRTGSGTPTASRGVTPATKSSSPTPRWTPSTSPPRTRCTPRTRSRRSRPASTCSCEKPFTMNAAEARQLVARRAQRGLFLHGGDVDALPAAHRADPAAARRRRARRDRHRHRRPRPVVRAGPDAPAVRARARRRRAARPRHLPGLVRLDGARRRRTASTAIADPAFTGVDGQTSMLLGYAERRPRARSPARCGRRPDARLDRRHRGPDRDRRHLLRARRRSR